MEWATKKRLMLFGGVGLFLLAAIALTLIAVMYKAPSCTDGKENGNEAGIDCGGSCTYLCSSSFIELKEATFVRPLSQVPGRTDIIAYVENPNAAAAVKGARYTVELYGADNTLLAKKDLTLDLPAGRLVPIFLPAFYFGNQPAVRAFLSFDTSSLQWFASPAPVVPTTGDVHLDVSNPLGPRLTATLTNPSAEPLYNLKVVATLFDGQKNAIAASQTVLPLVPAQGSASAIFTWPAPFSGIPVRIEVVPVLSVGP